MTGRRPWFAVLRPRPGKVVARPIHPLGWAALIGLPLPGLATGALATHLAGRPAGAAAALVATLVCGYTFVRLVARDGRRR